MEPNTSTNTEFRKIEKNIRKLVVLSKDVKARKKIRKGINKAQCVLPYDVSKIIDPHKSDNRLQEVIFCEKKRHIPNDRHVFAIDGMPEGFYIITNAFTVSEQLMWAKIALQEYSTAEHTNLTNLEKSSREQNKGNGSTNKDESIHNSHTNKSNDIWQKSILDNNNFKRFKDLRWASLGYHYDWTKRMYEENAKSKFPSNLAALCQELASLVGENITAEAAIVNFYPVGSYMSGHLDDAEQAMEEPIVSISLGCPAIFLVGGKTTDTVPTPILVRSGDVIVMSKDSRFAYHGVPAIIPHNLQNNWIEDESSLVNSNSTKESSETTSNPCCDICKTGSDKSSQCDEKLCSKRCQKLKDIDIINNNSNLDDEKLSADDTDSDRSSSDMNSEDSDICLNDPVFQYLKQGRININVRRVVKPNCTWTDKHGSGASYT